MDPPAPALIRDTTPRRRSRILPGLNSITQTVRDTIVTITEPLSPSLRSEFNLADSSSSSPGLEKHRHWNIVHHRASADATSLSRTTTISPPRTLTTLPPEIQIVILSFLEFGDILRLRRTSKHWYHFATPRLVRSIYGPETFRAMLIEHCSLCLTYCPRDVTRLVTTRLDPGYPLSSRCVRCTVQSGDGAVSVGRKTTLGNFVDYWTCRWCGWPVTADASTGHPQFHRACYDKYAVVLLAFFLLGWVQFFIGVVAAALAWRYFRRDVVVLAPTIVGFVLMWVCIFLIMFRGNRVRTYHWALFIELAIVGLWIPPIYVISRELATDTLNIAKRPAEVILTFLALNILFRILNVLGNIILLCEYDRTRHYVPRIPVWRRFMNPMLTALIFWTYPQHAERKRAPDWT